MKNVVLRSFFAILGGLIIGSVVNIGRVMVSSSIIPPPTGADVPTTEGLKQSMHLFEPKHFLFPFLAHALGTFAGAYACSRIAISYYLKLSLVVAIFFLIGGIVSVATLPSPLWFSVTDIALAYLPMGWLGWKAGKGK